MKRTIKILEHQRKIGLGRVQVTHEGLLIIIPLKKMSIPFKSITLFEDSITTTTHETILDGLSFLIEFKDKKKKKKKRVLHCYIVDKEETELSFSKFIQTIRHHLPSKKEDKSQYYGSYGVRPEIRYIANGIFGFPAVVIIVAFIMRIPREETIPAGDFVLIPAVSLLILISWKLVVGRKIIIRENELIFESMWIKKVIPYSAIFTFVRDLSALKGQRTYLYLLYYRQDNNIKRVTFAYNFTENTSALIHILKYKLKLVPQVTWTGLPWNKKEKLWLYEQTY